MPSEMPSAACRPPGQSYHPAPAPAVHSLTDPRRPGSFARRGLCSRGRWRARRRHGPGAAGIWYVGAGPPVGPHGWERDWGHPSRDGSGARGVGGRAQGGRNQAARAFTLPSPIRQPWRASADYAAPFMKAATWRVISRALPSKRSGASLSAPCVPRVRPCCPAAAGWRPLSPVARGGRFLLPPVGWG